MTEPAPLVPAPSTPCFLFLCWDGPQSAALRKRDLDGHLAHVEAHWRRYIVAGPMRDVGGKDLVGSMFAVMAQDEADAWALMRADPYLSNGQYARIEVKALTPAIGLWLGGRTWENADALRARAAGG
ncbi:MAG: YciI family protein [Alphaproteobacteria bacterium]|jgi:uncharacterized protein YciI|nr:YciI family protein [Alphaproteobacteria bacterium]